MTFTRTAKRPLNRSLARDLLRIVVLIPFYSVNIERVIERAWWWADDIYAVVPPGVTVDAATLETPLASYADIDVMQQAFDDCVQKLRVVEGDYMAIIYPDEVIVQTGALKPAIRNSFGKSIGVSVISMHNETEYRTDWRSGLTVWPLFPYKPHGKFFAYGKSLRGPNYVHELESVQIPAATMLSYQFASPEQREFWATKFGDQSLVSPPVLDVWTGGGTL